MPKDTNDLIGFMTRDGRGGPCLISPEESRRIAEWENIELDMNSEIMSDYKWIEIARNIEANLPKSERAYYRNLMNRIATDLGNPIPFPEDNGLSKSYIRIVCEENAIPRFNVIQLRNTPPTKIELKGGENILPVEAYPDLKFGFSQIDDYILDDSTNEECPYEYNGEGIVSIDFSHFDASQMKSMDYMFHRMCLDEIIFGKMDTSHVTSMVGTFDSMETKEVNLCDLDFSSVKDMSDMFSSSLIHIVQLPKLPALKLCENMFDQVYINHIIFNSINEYDITKVVSEIYTESDLKLSFNGVQEFEIVKSIIKTVESLNSEFTSPIIVCDFGNNIKYKTIIDANGNIECLLALIYQEEKNASKNFEIKGSTIIKVKDSKIKIAHIPDGITDIGEHAFRGCKNLETVILPESIERIHHFAFAGCDKLVRINIPNKVESIGELVFDGCKSLKHLYLPNSISYCCSLGDTYLDFLRIPYDVWKGWISHSTTVKNLVIGLPRYTRDFDIRPLDEFLSSMPSITFEPFEASSDGCDIDGMKVIDGMMMGVTKSNDENTFESVLGVFSIPKTTLALPLGVEKICACYSKANCLYIPETVCEIDEGAFETFQRPIEFVTKASNMEHLFNTLPISLGIVKIHTI